MYINVSEHSNVHHLALSATKIVLDVVKFVTFAITCVFIILGKYNFRFDVNHKLITFSRILVFGVPGHNQFSPTWCYILTTLIYYALTDPWTHEHANQVSIVLALCLI